MLKCEGATDEVSIVDDTHKYPLRRSWVRLCAFTETGYVNGIVFDQIIGKFCQVWHTNNPGLYLWLFGDHLGCHLNIDTVRRAWTFYVGMWSRS